MPDQRFIRIVFIFFLTLPDFRFTELLVWMSWSPVLIEPLSQKLEWSLFLEISTGISDPCYDSQKQGKTSFKRNLTIWTRLVRSIHWTAYPDLKIFASFLRKSSGTPLRLSIIQKSSTKKYRFHMSKCWKIWFSTKPNTSWAGSRAPSQRSAL